MNLYVLVLVFPLFKKNRPNGAVKSTGKEGQEWTLRSRRPTDQIVYGTTSDVNFRQRDILRRLESLGSVSIAQHAYRIISQIRNRARSLWPPIVARKIEMISSKASVPIGVSSCDDVDVILDSSFYGAKVTRVSYIHEFDHHCYTKR
ncbi:hypothetical protein V8G54_020511 [Vigna mungo]|uniref:Uncharacterized protein n=1 Tax=Vigna mungo TaxID=3915 RepID=A0AAQ3NDW3_VIGMU